MSMNAWVLELGNNIKAAVGGRELLHLIDVPTTFKVAYAPQYCNQVVSWQGRLLPVMDIASRLGSAGQEAQFIAVVGYQHSKGETPQFGAIALSSTPKQLAVSDEQACVLPENFETVAEIAISCFDYHGVAVPVLNLNRLFESAPSVNC